MLNVGDFGTTIKIAGHPAQIAMEFMNAARTVRDVFCENLGEEQGNEYFEFVLDTVKKTDADISEEVELMKKKNPELVDVLEHSSLMQKLMKCLGEA